MRFFISLLVATMLNAQVPHAEYVRHKALHVVCSGASAFVLTGTFGSWKIGISATLVLGIVKEIDDHRASGESLNSSKKDEQLNFAGAVIGGSIANHLLKKWHPKMSDPTMPPALVLKPVVIPHAPPLINTTVCWRLEPGFLRGEMK
jgi:hypothetical protein